MSNAIWQFSSLGATASVSTSAGASTAATVLSGGDCDTVLVQNSGADTIFVKFGNSTVQATTSDTPVLAGQSLYIAVWGLAVTHFAVYSATGSITVYATRGRGDEVDTQLLVSGGGSATPLQFERFVTPGAATFTYTSSTRLIYVSGCSGGGGGGGGYGGAGGGGGGGGPAPMFFMLPLELAAGGGQLDLFIGSGGALGAVGGAGATGATGGDGTETTIVGHTATEILSPYVNASNQILLGKGFGGVGGAAGAGGNGSGAIMASTAFAHYGTENTGTGHASRWWYTADGFPSVEWLLPICQGAGGGAVSANGGSRNAGGLTTINGRGFGNSGTGNASGGGGGGGGGGPYGLGGLGGSNAGNAANGQGFGFGGGGGSGNANGTAGGNGFLVIWY